MEFLKLKMETKVCLYLVCYNQTVTCSSLSKYQLLGTAAIISEKEQLKHQGHFKVPLK